MLNTDNDPKNFSLSLFFSICLPVHSLLIPGLPAFEVRVYYPEILCVGTISNNTQVVGYDFDSQNETATIVVEVDERTTLTIQDIAGLTSQQQVSYRTEVALSGVHEYTLEARKGDIGNRHTQAVFIADSKEQIGSTVFRDEPSEGLFSNLDWWMIPLASLVGGGIILLLTLRWFKNKEQEGVGNFIPLS